nr:reverse transcriptase domain-containing protein [Tanacetum cinerariifolium]
MTTLTTKIDSQFKEIKGEMKEMRDGCNIYEGHHPSSECDDMPMGGPKDEESNYAYGASIQDLEIKFGRLSNQCSSQPTGSLPCNTQSNPKPNLTNDKPYRLPFARNEHVNAVFTRSGLMYGSPVNPNAKTTVIHDDSEDEVDAAKKELESSSSKQAKSDPPPL